MNVTTLQKDFLTEMTNISLGNSATAVSNMIKEKVLTVVPSFQIASVEAISDVLGLAEELVTVVLLTISGDLTGSILLFIDPKDAQRLDTLLGGKPPAVSALPELGNIITGNALASLSKFLHLQMTSSIPDVATDMRRALVISSVFQMGEEADEVLALGTTLSIPAQNMTLQLYFLFDEAATHTIINSAR